MRKIFQVLIVVMMVTCSVAAMAQNNGSEKKQRISRQQEQLAERQAKYIAQQLAFDEPTTAKFIATYVSYMEEAWSSSSKPKIKSDQMAGISEDELAKINQARFDTGRKLIDIRQKYYEEYSKFLTQKQIQRVYQLERGSINHLEAHKQGKSGMQPKGTRGKMSNR